MFDDVGLVGGDGGYVVAHLVVGVFIVDVDGGEIVVEGVADDGGGGADFGDEFLRAADALETVGHALPTVHELAEVGVEFGDILAFGNGADDDAEILWFDALHEPAETSAFLFAFNLLRDCDTVAEGSEDEVAPCEGDIARQFRAFGGDGFFGHLSEDKLADFEDIVEVAVLFHDGLYLEVFEGACRGVAVHGKAEVFVDRLVVEAQVEVMHEAVLVLAHVDEGGIEAGHDFPHLAYVNVPHLYFAVVGFLVELDKLFVFEERYLDALVSG